MTNQFSMHCGTAPASSLHFSPIYGLYLGQNKTCTCFRLSPPADRLKTEVAPDVITDH